MAGKWKNSDRRSRLPADWKSRRARVFRRANGVCEVVGCSDAATDCDHILRGDDHSLSNLRALCQLHHAQKSSAEGNAAREWIREARMRPVEGHPGRRRR